MKALAQASLFVVFAVVAGVVGVIVWVLWEVGTRAIDALDAIGPGLFEAGALVTFGVFVFLVVGGAVAIVRWMGLKSRAVHPGATGLYPMQYHGPAQYLDLNAPNVQQLAVMHAAGRATSASVGKVLDWQPAPVAEIPAPVAPLTPSDVVDVDPRTSPHWLLVGSTGSGKTVASYRILSELTRRNPCQVTICEPGGVNWAGQATATNTKDIAQTIGDVHSELVRRQDLLRSADVDHVQDLPEPLPYVILLTEEAEAVLDDLRLVDKPMRDATVVGLRNIARMGRKCGIILVAITQSGTTDLLDGHMRRNFGNVLLFRSEHTIPEMWRLKGVKLSDLPPGAAYSVRHGGLVSFPLTARPVLQLAQPLTVPSGIAVDNWPTTRRLGAVVPVVGGCTPILQPGREPDAQLAATMRQWYRDGVSKSEICRRIWSYKDGTTWSILDRVLGGDL